MPSAALTHWSNDRMLRLAEFDAHCAATLAGGAATALLADESLRGYVLLISGHFEGYCRDLYTECVQAFAITVPSSMFMTIHKQFLAELKLNIQNPSIETIRKDFERFDIILDLHAEPANGPRLTHLGHLNKWRNAIAHQNTGLPKGLAALTFTDVQSWRISCDGLATWLDGKMYRSLSAILNTPPW